MLYFIGLGGNTATVRCIVSSYIEIGPFVVLKDRSYFTFFESSIADDDIRVKYELSFSIGEILFFIYYDDKNIIFCDHFCMYCESFVCGNYGEFLVLS